MIYWDNNATTRIADAVLDAMLPYLRECYMNPSSGYGQARHIRNAIEEARAGVAALAGVSPDEIIFTSGATESINTVVRGMRSLRLELPVMGLSTDHSATLHALEGTAVKPGGTVFCPVDSQGGAVMEEWSNSALRGLAGATFTWGNNETGALQQAGELVRMAHAYNVPVHVDAVQCLGKIPVDMHSLGNEYASFSAHKLHGPKGTGALYVRSGVALPPMMLGGDQEHGRRGGTENVAGIVGFGAAARLAMNDLQRDIERMARHRDSFEQLLASSLENVTVLSSGMDRLPNTSNIMFGGCTAQALFLLLEPWGLLCSAGSACKTASPHPSHVLTAMGLTDGQARSCLRFSMSPSTTDDEVEEGARLVIEAVKRVRSVQSSRTGPVTVYTP